VVRLQITLDPQEAISLARWAASELRDPREQIHLYLRQELLCRGYLIKDFKAQSAQLEQAARVEVQNEH
jgi:hypothetical protein